MRIPVERLGRSALIALRLEIVDLDCVHTSILEQIESAARIAKRLHLIRAHALQDIRICRAVVSVVGNGERLCVGHGQEEGDSEDK